jgi:hypothetical protein
MIGVSVYALGRMPNTFTCELCSFVCGKKSNFEKHLTTRKHQLKTLVNKKETQLVQKNASSPGNTEKYACGICAKQYSGRSGLWKHQKNCKESKIQTRTNNKMMALLLELLKENREIKELMMTQPPVIIQQQITTNNHAHISLNMFLQEKCKAALNISEFVDNLNIEMTDLEMVGKMGYVEGISRIIVNELRRLDIYTRPIHCTDKKRETIYIKERDEWMRDTETKEYTRRVIERVSSKNLNKLPEWRKQHPLADVLDTPDCDKSMNIMIQSLGGLGGTAMDKTVRNQDKIIRVLTDAVFLDREKLSEIDHRITNT